MSYLIVLNFLAFVFFLAAPEDMVIGIRVREKERGREGENHRYEGNIDWFPPCIHPDWGLNPQSFGVRDDAPFNQLSNPARVGLCIFLC